MDAPDLDPELHRRALIGLSRLNRLSGVSRKLYRQVARLASASGTRPFRVLDVASGSGDLPIAWLRMARADNVSLDVTALDRSDLAMRQAADAARRSGVPLKTITRDCLRDGLPDGYDLAVCSLFMHHLEESEAAMLVKEMFRVGGGRMMICDLDRSRLNLALVSLAARVVTRSPVVHFDASASMRGAYTRVEFASLVAGTLDRSFRMRRLVPCRFLMTTDPERSAS